MVLTIEGNEMKWYFINSFYDIAQEIKHFFWKHIETMPNEIPNQIWRNYQDLEINTAIYKKGILIVKPYGTPIETSEGLLSDESSFYISSRKLFFSQRAIIMEQGSKAAATLKKTILLLNTLKKHTEGNNSSVQDEDFIIINKARREEVFLPFIIRNNGSFGFYIYPWLSNNNTDGLLHFSGFKQFVTAGCMFGSTLKGIDNIGFSFPLIKHDIKFHDGQHIIKIDFNKKACNPYEEVIFNEFQKVMLLITNLSTIDDEPKQLYYHLPYYDYMLFGIELFVSGRMTLPTLDQFFKEIISKKDEHTHKINSICAKHNIECKIGTPFENLFGELPQDNITETILAKLGLELPTEKPNNQLDYKQEQELVQRCLIKLQTNTLNIEHQQVWQDFIKMMDEDKKITVKIIGKDKISTLEDLIKIANASMILLACKGKKDYETCSLLPLSEKQIQVSYENFKKFKRSRNIYPAVFNITMIDPIISYDLISKKGLLFYLGCCQDSLSKLVKHDILTHAHKNIALNAESKDNTGIEDIATSLTKCHL